MRYRNPVLPGFYPDPSVCRVGSDFYLVTSSFEYFPGVPIFHSRDLVHWRQLGHVLTRPSQLPLAGVDASGGIYAPTLRHHDGVFYMVTTHVSAGGNFYVKARDPQGPWSEPVWVAQKGIDPSLFFDEDGSVYFTSSDLGVVQSRIDIQSGKLLGEPVKVWAGTGAQHTEAPHLYRKDGWYYLLVAEGGTEYGHMACMARSRSPWGPFEACARNPVLSHRSLWSPIQALGHADLVQAESGEWFAVFLGVRPVGYPPCYHLGRETFLAPVRWAEDGFPVIGDQGRVALDMESPLASAPQPAEPERDDFDAPALAPYWNHLRNPDPSLYSLSERPGWLRLKGAAAGLDEAASPAWVGRRQRHFALSASTHLEFEPQDENEEAGLTLRMNEKHHYELFVTRRQGRIGAVLRRRIGSLQAETAFVALEGSGASRLAVEAQKERYRFFVGERCVGEAETRYLSTEVAGGFTGVYLALYATGNGRACAGPADFDYFDYRPAPEA